MPEFLNYCLINKLAFSKTSILSGTKVGEIRDFLGKISGLDKIKGRIQKDRICKPQKVIGGFLAFLRIIHENGLHVIETSEKW